MEGTQRPLELILARNLLASLTTPAFLIDARGEIAFYNEATGAMLGRRYEDTGPLPVEVWAQLFGPVDDEGRPRSFEELELTRAVRANRPAHERLMMRPQDGPPREIEASALPIVGAGGHRGAMVVFWTAEEEVA